MQSQDKPLILHNSAVTLNDLGVYGIDTVAYVKPVMVDGQRFHSIHAADGTPLTVIPGRDLAFATARQYDLEPASVH